MSNQTKSQFPKSGIPGSEEQSTPFKLTFPENEAIKDSDHIQRPVEIIDFFRGLSEPFTSYRFMFDHLLNLLGNNFFESYTKNGAEDFSYRYSVIADLIYQMEEHSADSSLEFHMRNFLELVMKKDKAEITQINEAMQELIVKYGSLTNGIHHFVEDWREIRRGTKSENK